MTNEERGLYRLAAQTAALAALFSLVSLICISFMQIFPGIMGLLAQTRNITLRPWGWSLTFIFAALAAMVQVPVVLGVADLLKTKTPLHAKLALAHGLIGLALTAVSQFMQATLVRKAALEMMAPEQPERLRAALLALSGQWNPAYPFSTAFALTLLGQTFFAVMFLCLGLAWRRQPGLKKIIARLSLLAASAQALALILYFSDLDTLTLIPAGIADLLLLPILAILAIIFLREARTESAES